MRIATWNVNSIRARKDRVLAWLQEHGPEALCLQETKTVDENFPFEEFREIGYEMVTWGQKTYNGVAICARSAITNVVRGFEDGIEEQQARIITGTVQNTTIICAYVPNGQSVGSDKYQFKLAWLKRLRNFLNTRFDPMDPVVLCGDFNIAPEDRDVYDPQAWAGKILCSEHERTALQELVEWGLSDSLRLHNQDAGLYSWWDYRQLGFPKNRGLRIDHIYLSQGLVPHCKETTIDRNARKGKQPSDHAPVIVRLGCSNMH